MTADSQLERTLMTFFASESQVRAPIDVHAAAMARVDRARQRPGVVARLRNEQLLAPGMSRTRLLILAAAALLLLVLAGAFTAGVFRFGPGGTITYVLWGSTGSPAYSIWMVAGDGSGDREIGSGECPSVSAHGEAMVFVSGRQGDQKGQMIAANGDGSGQHVLAGVDAWTGAISPDGRDVAWVKDLRRVSALSADGGILREADADDELWVSPLSGGPGIRIVPHDESRIFSFGGPSWSPSGDRIAFLKTVVNLTDGPAIDASVWVVDADGSNLRELGPAMPGARISPALGVIAWSPNGQSFTYLVDSGAETRRVSVALDGSAARLLPDPGGPVSPDGRFLLVVEQIHVGTGSHADSFAGRLSLVDVEHEGPPRVLLERERSIGDFYGCPAIWTP